MLLLGELPLEEGVAEEDQVLSEVLRVCSVELVIGLLVDLGS